MENTRETLIVNLFGAPGCGKSTLAAALFSELKKAGFNAELVTEYAKDKVYEKNQTVFQNQIYILGKQSYRISRLDRQVDVVITDSPILLSAIYNPEDDIQAELEALVVKMFQSYWSFNVLLKRGFPYQTDGRIHTERQSDHIHEQLVNLLNKYHIPYSYYQASERTEAQLLKQIVEKISRKDR